MHRPEETGLRVLVVDDNDIGRYTTIRMLERSGFVADGVATGADALERAVGHDAVVLDINLPDMSGGEVCAQLRAETATSQLAIVHLSATAIASEQRISGLESGADAYLTSPVVQGELAATLRAAVRARYAQSRLVQAQKLETVGRLAAGIAHDFNNLLLVILASNEEALATLDPSSPVHAAAVEIKSAAERAAQLSRQLLEFSGRQRTKERACVAVDEAVQSSVDLFRRVLGEDIRLDLDLDADSYAVAIGAGELEQVVMNLVINARDAMAGGGSISIRTSYDDDRVRICVADSGPGVPPELRERIFEPFFTTKRSGDGLGLATVFGIVSHASGTVTIEDAPDGGAVFCVDLPAASRPAAAEEEHAAPERLERLTILVVEDEAAVRRIVRSLLERAGHRVLEADCGTAALELVEGGDSRPDVLLTDVVMPGMGGVDVADAVTAVSPGLRCVFMSGYADDPRLTDRLARTHERFVAKPFDRQALLDAVGAAD